MYASILFFITVFVAIFSILNPVGAVPILVSMTEGYTRNERNSVIRKSIMVAGGMLFGFTILGIYIFQGLGISIADFQVAGGILVFKVAFDMMQGKTSNTKLTATEQEESLQKDSIGVVPLGTPLLAGPGSITTAIIYFNLKSVSISDRLLVFLAIAAVLVVSLVILIYAVRIFEKIGKTGSLILSRIMGLLIAAVGVSFIAEGVSTLFPILG